MARIDLMRRRVLAGATFAGFLSRFPSLAQAAEEPLMTRPIPQGGERIPVVGIGTAVIFDYQDDAAKQAARSEVIKALVAAGGRLIDTAAGYGSAEDRLGEIVAALGARGKLVPATHFFLRLGPGRATASLRDSPRPPA